MRTSKTAGIIIIGNEILSGKVRDSNSYYLVSELRALGVDVRRISVISDEIEVIGRETAEFSNRYDYVFTSGGVGPTHDDVTMEGIAKGFGVKLAQNEEIRKFLVSRYKSEVNSAVTKMTMIPEGSEVTFSENMRFPVVSFRNIFIFPGIPEYVRSKFPLIKEMFRATAFKLKRLFLDCHEADIAETLNSVVEKYDDVMFGSYPVLGEPDYRVVVTAESKFDESLERSLDELVNRLPKEIIVRIE
jgi:molybdenum cofactor synthesis domain-containing protein